MTHSIIPGIRLVEDFALSRSNQRIAIVGPYDNFNYLVTAFCTFNNNGLNPLDTRVSEEEYDSLPNHEKYLHAHLKWPNGSTAKFFNADKPDDIPRTTPSTMRNFAWGLEFDYWAEKHKSLPLFLKLADPSYTLLTA